MTDFQITDDLPPLLPDGRYQFEFEAYETALMVFGGAKVPKLVLHFKVTDQSKYEGLGLKRFYNVKKLISAPGANGKFAVSGMGEFAREYFRLFPDSTSRLDRLAMSNFKATKIIGEVEAVTRARGQDIPRPLQYSRISRLLEVDQ